MLCLELELICLLKLPCFVLQVTLVSFRAVKPNPNTCSSRLYAKINKTHPAPCLCCPFENQSEGVTFLFSVSICFSLGLSCFSLMLCFPRACCFALSGCLFTFCLAVYTALIYLLIHSLRHSFIFILAATRVLLPFHYL